MRLIGLILLLLSTATCGQEGPLYLPEASSSCAEWHPPGPSSLTNASHDFR